MNKVSIATGCDEEGQESDFMNSTLQGAGNEVAFSIATELDVPKSVYELGEQGVAEYLQKVLTIAASAAAEYGLAFDVQVGPSRDACRERQR